MQLTIFRSITFSNMGGIFDQHFDGALRLQTMSNLSLHYLKTTPVIESTYTKMHSSEDWGQKC